MEFKAIDGFFEISQDRDTGKITVTKYGEVVREIDSKRLLNMEELHSLLIGVRTAYFTGGKEDEQ